MPAERNLPLRAFTAGLGVETNTFSALEVGWSDFARTFLYRPAEHPEALTEVSAPLYILRRRARAESWEVVEGTYAFALPAGRCQRTVYESLRDEILGQLAAALPVDLVALSLHGAMCAEGYNDCEGDLLARIRSIVGSDVPVGIEIDPHAHLSDAMIEHADILVAFKEYPHVDFLERGTELIDMLERCARENWRPKKGVYDCRMIGRFHTMREPMKGFVADMKALEARTDVASVSLVHGFPWGDIEEMGAKVLVLADGVNTARSLARELGRRLLDMREATFTPPLPLADALAEALARPHGPVVLADVSDNPGGGAGGDSTLLLERLLEAGVDACLGPFWDPETVKAAHAAGEGAQLELKLGGKTGAGSGQPLQRVGEVVGLSEEARQTWAGTEMSLGRACAVRIGEVTVVVSSIRDQAYGPDLFRALNVEPANKRIVAVKSAQHFAAGFAPLARATILASGGGPLEADFRKIPYRRVRRPIWPLDDIDVTSNDPGSPA